jgi:hypothetical protein
VRPHTDVVSLLSDVLDKVLVDSNTACLKSLRRNLLLLVTYKMGYEGEKIDRCQLVTNIVNLDLGLGYTTTIPTLDVGLVLLVTVTTSWTASHGELFIDYWFTSVTRDNNVSDVEREGKINQEAAHTFACDFTLLVTSTCGCFGVNYRFIFMIEPHLYFFHQYIRPCSGDGSWLNK